MTRTEIIENQYAFTKGSRLTVEDEQLIRATFEWQWAAFRDALDDLWRELKKAFRGR